MPTVEIRKHPVSGSPFFLRFNKRGSLTGWAPMGSLLFETTSLRKVSQNYARGYYGRFSPELALEALGAALKAGLVSQTDNVIAG